MPRSPRRLGLLDLMILVAALAIGLAWVRFQASLPESFDNPVGLYSLRFAPPPRHWALKAAERAWELYSLAVPVMIAVPIGLLAIRLRKPRPRGGRAWLQPGAVACAAVTAAMGVGVLRFGVEWLLSLEEAARNKAAGIKDYSDWWDRFYFLLRPSDQGIAVVVALTILALSGRWRAEKSAIDRLGRCVGIYWVVALLLSCVGGEA
jgi:hypothetical protein